jgi:hypothetical protein
MFVDNCVVSELVRFLDSNGIEAKEGDGDSAPFRSVYCGSCKEVVGMFDQDEVYHFFNVIPSYI